LYEYVYSLSNGLRKAGFRKGDVAILCLPNCPEYALICLSVLQCGGIISGLYYGSTKNEMANRFKDCECRFIFTVSQVVDTVLQASNGSTFMQKIFVIDLPSKKSNSTKIEDWNSLFFTPRGDEEIDETGIWTKIDLALLPFTSGSKSTPKGIMFSHYNVVTALQLMSHKFFIQPSKGDYLIGVHPFFDLYGFMLMLQSLQSGSTMVTMSEFDPAKYYGLIQMHKVPILHLSTPLLILLAKDPLLEKYDITSVTTCFVRAGHTSKALSEKLLERHQQIKHLIQAYGPMESCLAGHSATPVPKSELNVETCGVLLPGAECKIIDPNSNKEMDKDKKRRNVHQKSNLHGWILERSRCYYNCHES